MCKRDGLSVKGSVRVKSRFWPTVGI